MSYPKRDRAYVNRLSSFEPGFCPVSNEALALAGFRYEGPEDQVRCDYCQGRFKSWREGDDPLEEHKEHFKNCPFLRPLLVLPKHQEFSHVAARESSFQDRLRQYPNMSPTPEEFATCGFFSNPGGSEDRDSVTCYYCGVTLARWSYGDDVWKEHVKNNPACAFIVLDKGAEYLVTGPYASLINQQTGQTRRPPPSTSDPSIRRRSLGSSPIVSTASHPTPPSSRSFVPVQADTPRPATPPRSTLASPPPLITDIPLSIINPVRNNIHSPLTTVSRSSSATSPHPNRYSPISVTSLRNGFNSEFMRPSPIRNMNSSPSNAIVARQSPSYPSQRLINSRRSPILLSQNSRISPYTIPNRNSINHRAPEPLPDNFEGLSEDERRLTYDHLRRQHECKVCLSNLATVCFLPCRHLSACPACAPQLENCHVCRERIVSVIDVFLS
ncbi:unnamed protein product [Oikopleura dioica]|uniref:RING-type domain-containing protein n=1 Tax=Oikopleura dioica TaxID=34765 RepID=E4XD90_OIKDI|nr:unnamed protein product [Oikopleura dioica]CBY30764.1 unnamed protein product [Oikopleura dioica]